MIIKKLKVWNYRNYVEEELEFSENINILYGDNAQGKTNILESIYICGTTRSHQGSKDKEIIRLDEDESHIRMYIEKKGLEHRIDMHLKKNKPKGIAINGVPIKKISELVGFINMIFFSPEDLSIIKRGPSERRRFLDMELCQLDKIYLDNLTRYNKVLNQRNHFLKQIKNDEQLKDTLSVWDDQLVYYGSKIIQARDEFLLKIDPIAADIHSGLTGSKETLKISYEPNVVETQFKETLERNYEKDMYLQNTSCGPHRDDIKFLINDIDVRTYGSQGQKRTAALSLKLSEIELVKNRINDVPVLLLDDVLSELDRNRQNFLLDYLKDIQTIITCTGLEELVKNRISADRIYRINNGNVVNED